MVKLDFETDPQFSVYSLTKLQAAQLPLRGLSRTTIAWRAFNGMEYTKWQVM